VVPGAFIAHAEESGLIVPIGEWTLRQACRHLRIWRDAGHRELRMAVNLSPRQLEAGLPASALELEITESILLQRSEFNLTTLTKLRNMGIRLSVDEFGTGHSSLAYLQRFPVQALKIDKSFVHDIGTDPNHTALITAIIAMGNSLQLGGMAEGMETWEQANFLLAHASRHTVFITTKRCWRRRFSDLLYRSMAPADVDLASSGSINGGRLAVGFSSRRCIRWWRCRQGLQLRCAIPKHSCVGATLRHRQ
jgi:hypothetical protein